MADKKELPLALIQILTKYTDEDHYLSTTAIIHILETEYGLTCERRTIYANVDLLKQYGHNISTWQENGIGYYLKEHQFSEKEVLAMCESLQGTKLSSKEQRLLKSKLLSTLSDAQRQTVTHHKKSDK